VREIETSPNYHTAFYTPLAGQPGFGAGFAVTYGITSSLPEPGVLPLAVCGAGVGLIVARLRRKKASV
jgi:hypothetical protein